MVSSIVKQPHLNRMSCYGKDQHICFVGVFVNICVTENY